LHEPVIVANLIDALMLDCDEHLIGSLCPLDKAAITGISGGLCGNGGLRVVHGVSLFLAITDGRQWSVARQAILKLLG
jgi:hypothetical protein